MYRLFLTYGSHFFKGKKNQSSAETRGSKGWGLYQISNKGYESAGVNLN